MVTIYTNLYQPDQKFNNRIKWEGFRTLTTWNEVITHFKDRMEDFFFSPIKLLYKCSFFGKIKFVHNFPISNISWSLLDLFTQLESGSKVNGKDVDNFLSNKRGIFKNIGAAIILANSYNFSVYDIFRNKPFHNAMVKGLGSLDHLPSDAFTISKCNVEIDGISSTIDIIIENPIKLFKAIEKYFHNYVSDLKKNLDLQRKFKKRIEELFEFKFKHI